MEKDTLHQLIGNNLRKYRTMNAMTQETLAEKVGISTSYCANLECGNKGMSLSVLRSVIDTLNISADCLLYEEQSNSRFNNIIALLRNEPDSFIVSMENLIRLCKREFPYAARSGNDSPSDE